VPARRGHLRTPTAAQQQLDAAAAVAVAASASAAAATAAASSGTTATLAASHSILNRGRQTMGSMMARPTVSGAQQQQLQQREELMRCEVPTVRASTAATDTGGSSGSSGSSAAAASRAVVSL
jgi:hypothetical protein